MLEEDKDGINNSCLDTRENLEREVKNVIK